MEELPEIEPEAVPFGMVPLGEMFKVTRMVSRTPAKFAAGDVAEPPVTARFPRLMELGTGTLLAETEV